MIKPIPASAGSIKAGQRRFRTVATAASSARAIAATID
jgi:hypothetical protein